MDFELMGTSEEKQSFRSVLRGRGWHCRYNCIISGIRR